MPAVDESERRSDAVTPELRLVRAILARAIEDAFSSPDSSISQGADMKDRREAIAFLTARHGSFARSRNELAELAGFDGEILRERVIAILDGDKDPSFLTGDPRRSTAHMAKARAIWAEMNKGQADWFARRMADKEKVRLQIAKDAQRAAAKERSARRREEELAGAARQDAKVKLAAALLRNLEDRPKTTRELFFDMGGTLSDAAIDARLYRAQVAGLVKKNGRVWELPALPETPVEDAAA